MRLVEKVALTLPQALALRLREGLALCVMLAVKEPLTLGERLCK